MTEGPTTLLVVDDNEDNLDMLARQLERKGYVVLRASGGREALDVIARASPASTCCASCGARARRSSCR